MHTRCHSAQHHFEALTCRTRHLRVVAIVVGTASLPVCVSGLLWTACLQAQIIASKAINLTALHRWQQSWTQHSTARSATAARVCHVTLIGKGGREQCSAMPAMSPSHAQSTIYQRQQMCIMNGWTNVRRLVEGQRATSRCSRQPLLLAVSVTRFVSGGVTTKSMLIRLFRREGIARLHPVMNLHKSSLK